MRDPERRERYDFFLRTGFPRWTGMDYLFSRARPSLLLVLGFLATVFACMQYIIMQLNYRSKRRYMQQCINEARELAWPGSNGDYITNSLAHRRVIHPETNKEFRVEGAGQVSLIDSDGNEWPLDPNDIAKPTVFDTYIFTIPRSLIRRVRNSSQANDVTHEYANHEPCDANKKETEKQSKNDIENTLRLANGNLIRPRGAANNKRRRRKN